MFINKKKINSIKKCQYIANVTHYATNDEIDDDDALLHLYTKDRDHLCVYKKHKT